MDGSIHLEEEVKNHDEERQKLLEAEGLTIMRFTNEEVLMKQEAVISSIEQFIGNHSERTK